MTPTEQAKTMSMVERRRYSWIGDDHPPGWKRVGLIDVADPADAAWARDRLWRIGAIYDGGSGSAAEPCTADAYKEIDVALSEEGE